MSDHPRATVIALGAHVLDVLARPVTEIPEGQGSTLVEEIRLAPAGAAGGTAVTLAKLGADTFSAGAVGSDRLGDVLLSELERHGVDTTHLVRREDVQTSATVLPIRPNGDRPALHVIGANGSYTPDDVPWERIESAAYLHMGGPEFLGPENAARILEFCGEHDVVTSVDLLADGWPELLDMLEPILAHIDFFLPNDDQARNLTGLDDLEEAGAALRDRGVRSVVATCGAEGSLIVDEGGSTRVPALDIEVVDTSGCGDAFTAGFLRGLSLGRDPAGAAQLGTAAAALVAQGLGSDAGDFDLDRVLAYAGSATQRGSS
jgi:sugar/nucleoside kinase (ribokinase family)